MWLLRKLLFNVAWSSPSFPTLPCACVNFITRERTPGYCLHDSVLTASGKCGAGQAFFTAFPFYSFEHQPPLAGALYLIAALNVLPENFQILALASADFQFLKELIFPTCFICQVILDCRRL